MLSVDRYSGVVHKVIERILNLLAFLLTVGRPVTAEEIRYTVKGYDQPSDEAFRRTFERDKDLLRTLGVPIQTTHTDLWEVELGYVVPSDDYTLADPGLTDEERSALLLAAEAVRFGGQPTELAAIFKLGGAPVSAPSSALAADLGHDLSSLGDLFDAVNDRKIVSFTYRDRPRSVQAYGLVHRYGHWYLVGPETSDPALTKVFRLDRMADVHVGESGGMFDRPKGFDAATALRDVVAQRAEHEASVVFDPEVVRVAMRRWPAATVVEDRDDGVVVAIPYSNERAFINWILGFDDRAEIIGPASLRNQLIAHVESVAP